MTPEAMLDRAARLTAHLPGITRAPHYRTEALKVGGKAFANPCDEPGVLAVFCQLPEKDLLLAAAPALYFDTPHFRNWPAILVRMAEIDDGTLAARLQSAWQMRAPAKLLRAWHSARG